ncbi:hypothetical protein HDU81_003699 [Chytriomyces hyalinus]|nr:hypothetical protein HDU81_003699 [Chytriomyces hyalinus]
MDACKLTPMYEQKIYDRALPDARFNDRNIVVDLSWSKNASMMPLFAATQDQLPGFSLQERSDFVRATQDMIWTPTQDVTPRSARTAFTLSVSEFDVGTLPTVSTKPGVNRNSIRPLISRSYVSDKDSTFFAYNAERKKKETKDVQKFRQEALRRSVTLYRSYREGELLDIEIKFKDVLDPLQSLALCDNETAQQLFASILTKVIASTSAAEKASPEAVSKAIGEIFQKSTMYSAPAMASLLRLVHNCPDLLKHISPRLVARAASASYNSELGALILENGIQSGTISAETKRAKMTNEFFKKSPPGWAQLASLYKGMKFQEVYQSIFESQITSNPITKEAISAELLGDFETAKEKYMEAISCATGDATDAEPGLWSVQRLECMNTLGEWSLLATTVLSDVDNDLGKLWSTENEEVYLPLFVRSHLKLQGGRSIDGVFVPWSEADPNPLTSFLKQARNDTQRIGLLESTFTPELAMISMLDGDMNLSHHFVEQTWKRIISQYAQLNSRTLVPKLQTLAKLQTNLELAEFCAFTQLAKAGSLSQSDVKTLFDNWRFRYPALSDPIGVWDDIIVSRKWMIEKSNGYLSADTPMGDAFRAVASQDDALYSRRMAAAATAQKLFTVADRWLDSANINPGTFEPAFMIQYYELQLGKVEFSREFSAKFEILKNLMQHMEYYKKSIRDTDELCQSKFITLETRLLSSLLATATNLQPADSFFANLGSTKSVTKFAGKRVDTKPELFRLFLSRAKQSLMNLHSLQIDSDNFQKGLINIGNDFRLFEKQCLMLEKFSGMFVDATLRASELEASVKEELGKQPESARLIMTSILRAMTLGSVEAIEFFPRLLQLLSEYPELHQDCIKLLDDCPCWMFLRWLPQLTAQLDKSSGSVLLPLISRIARRFPNALRYPLSISCERYNFSPEMSRNEQYVEQIKRIVQSDSYDRLALELRRLEDPVHVFKDLCDRFESLIGSSLPAKKSAMKQAYAEFKQICLEQRQAGLLIKKFAEKHTTKIAGICGSGDTLDSKKLKELVSYRDKFGAEAESKPGKNLLKSFSVWLDEYQSANVDVASQLEIPGQYTGDFDHNPAEHVKISSFDANVLVMSSMRRPKKIVMLGTDEKEYPWLVKVGFLYYIATRVLSSAIKGGEDLRLDQRIEQMFGIMNELMLRNPYCARNRISLATYKVIPMSTSLGIIEWVDGTKPLKSCLSESPLFEKRFQDSLSAYGEFVQRHGKSGQSFVASYDLFLQTASSKNVIDNIRSIWNKNRDSYLRDFFIKLTRSPEAFFHIRSEFANSLSALNICSYFLGIGDRHLDNFLVDLKSGRIVGIDFGHAFGSATEVLPVPELVPFRLTDQMDKFLQPLGVKSLMVHPMTSVLSSIQDGKDRLLNALNIFVNEPLIEWRKFAVKQMQKQGKSAVALDAMSDSLSAPEWYPQQKLEFARRKLDGENPAYITADELEVGHGKKKFFRQTKAACMGDKANNVRARVGRVCATPREQVDCLVDLAVDPNHRPGSSKMLDMAVKTDDGYTSIQVRGSESGHLDAFILLPNGTVQLVWSNNLGTRVAQLQNLTPNDAFPNGAVVAAAGSRIYFLDPLTGITLRTQEAGFTDAIFDFRISLKGHLHMCTRRMLFTTDLDGRELDCFESEGVVHRIRCFRFADEKLSANIVCFSIMNTDAVTVAIVGTSDRSVKIFSKARLLHEVKTPASPTAILSDKDVQRIQSLSIVYGTNQGTIHAFLLTKSETGFEETEIFKIDTSSTAPKTCLALKSAEISILTEGRTSSDGLFEFLSIRDDGVIQWYSASKVRRGVVPQLLSEKDLKTRVECLVWRSGFSEIVALTQAGDVVGLKWVEADPETMRILLDETKAEIEGVVESKRVAPSSTAIIEPQTNYAAGTDNITVKLKVDARNGCYLLTVDASNPIDSIALHTSRLILRNLTAVSSEDGPSGILSHQRHNSNEQYISAATFIATRKITRQSFTLVPCEGVLGTLYVFVTLAEPNLQCVQSVHGLKPFSYHQRVASVDSTVRLLAAVNILRETNQQF